MRIVERSQILWLGRIRGSYLSRFDSQMSLAQSTLSSELFICIHLVDGLRVRAQSSYEKACFQAQGEGFASWEGISLGPLW